MSEISYDSAALPVRPDLPAVHRRAWRRIAAPGNWWTGAERVAIAAEARNAKGCRLCTERREALSPNAVSGEHDAVAPLPSVAVEVIHRVTIDHGRLSRAWFEKTLAAGLDDAHYVELVGVVVTLVSIDSFCRGLGVPPHPLPEPLPGEPSRYRPAGALAEDAWVPMISFLRAKGDEADLYGGKPTGNVLRALSLVPDEVRTLTDLSSAQYFSIEQMLDLSAGRSLDRSQIELIAGRVSALNECFY
jgi:alkylhydroperoxidase family enzyme